MNNTLLLADSCEHIKTIPTGSINFICTDPPYNLRRYSTGNIKMSWRRDFNNDIATWDETPFYPADWVGEFQRVLSPKGNIAAFCSYNLLGEWHKAFDPVFDTFQYMIFHKTNPAPKIYKAGFLNACEIIIWCWNKGHTWNFGKQNRMHNFVESGICQGKERLRFKNGKSVPAQKPLTVMKHLIGLATSPGDLVYDPFAGAGSTCEAAALLGRSFLGVELGDGLDDEIYWLAEKRLRNYLTDNKHTMIGQHYYANGRFNHRQ